MPLVVTPTLDQLYAKLGDFIESVVPVGVVVCQMPTNRTAMPPPVPGFVGMTARVQARIMTNLDSWVDIDPTTIEIEQALRLAVTLNCYGAASSDWAVILQAVLRDEYAVGPLKPILSPLYTDEPMFAPLVDGEEEYEARWIVPAFLQYNPVVSVPQQFASTLTADLINVDERYPP